MNIKHLIFIFFIFFSEKLDLIAEEKKIIYDPEGVKYFIFQQKDELIKNKTIKVKFKDFTSDYDAFIKMLPEKAQKDEKFKKDFRIQLEDYCYHLIIKQIEEKTLSKLISHVITAKRSLQLKDSDNFKKVISYYVNEYKKDEGEMGGILVVVGDGEGIENGELVYPEKEVVEALPTLIIPTKAFKGVEVFSDLEFKTAAQIEGLSKLEELVYQKYFDKKMFIRIDTNIYENGSAKLESACVHELRHWYDFQEGYYNTINDDIGLAGREEIIAIFKKEYEEILKTPEYKIYLEQELEAEKKQNPKRPLEATERYVRQRIKDSKFYLYLRQYVYLERIMEKRAFLEQVRYLKSPKYGNQSRKKVLEWLGPSPKPDLPFHFIKHYINELFDKN